MQFEQTELVPLITLVNDGYTDIQFFEQVVAYAGKNIQNYVGINTNKPNTIRIIIYAANAEKWLTDLMTTIAAHQHTQFNDSLHAEISRLQTLIDSRQQSQIMTGGAHPHEALKVYNRHFMNRGLLRSNLDQPHTNPIFSISGDSATGKSHTWYLVRHMAEGKNPRPKLINIPVDDLDDNEPSTIMEALALKMGINTNTMPKDRLAQDSRISNKLVNWFIGQTHHLDQNIQWWIALDGLDKTEVHSSASDLAGHMAKAIDKGELMRMHLYILGAKPNYPLFQNSQAAITEETTSGIGRYEVREHIRKSAKLQNFDLSPESLDLLVDNLFEDLPTPLDHESIPEFFERYHQMVEKLLESVQNQ